MFGVMLSNFVKHGLGFAKFLVKVLIGFEELIAGFPRALCRRMHCPVHNLPRSRLSSHAVMRGKSMHQVNCNYKFIFLRSRNKWLMQYRSVCSVVGEHLE